MITIPNLRKLYLIRYKVDFRRGPESLLAEAALHNLNPRNGDVVIFTGKRRFMIKILCHDGTGLWMLYKRLEGCKINRRFRFIEDEAITDIHSQELSELLNWCESVRV